MSAQEQFVAKTQQLIAQARAMTPKIRARVIELLEETRKRVVAEVSAVDPASYQSAQLRVLARQIDQALDRFRAQLTQQVNQEQASAFRIGAGTVTEPLAAAGIPVTSYAGLGDKALAVAQGYTADLISGLSKDASAKVNAAIQRAFLGGQQLGDIIQQIGRAVSGTDKFSGLFSPIGERAESIATNEILRVHSMAAQAQLSDAALRIASLKKQWLHVPAAKIPRPAHVAASGQIRDANDPFEVDGEELMYPRDPNGSPENTINCHCLVTPYFDESALQPSARHQQILRSAGVEISVGA